MSSDNPYGPPPPGAWGQPPAAPGSGYAFGPFAPPPGSGPVGPPAPAPPPTGNRVRLVIVGAVVLALILVGIGAAVLVRSRTAVGPDPTPSSPGGPGSPSPSSAPPAAGPLASDAVSGYLTTLAAGDSQAALAYAARPLPAGPFLTDAVLATSMKRAPITDIAVPAVDDPQATTVAASYRIGSTAVQADYAVEQVGGQWKLSSVFKTLDLGLVRRPSLPITINGVKVTSDTVDVLPGSYAFAPQSPDLTLGSKAVVTVRDPGDYANVLDLGFNLSRTGRAKVVRLAEQRYGECIRSRITRPKNCPFRWVGKVAGGSFREGSVRWTQTGSDPWAKPRVVMLDKAARIQIPLRVRIAGPCSISGAPGTCSAKVTGTGVASVRMDRELRAVWVT